MNVGKYLRGEDRHVGTARIKMINTDYIVTAARGGKTYFRQRYKERTAALERFERMAGQRIETLGDHDRRSVKFISVPADDGKGTVTFRERT